MCILINNESIILVFEIIKNRKLFIKYNVSTIIIRCLLN